MINQVLKWINLKLNKCPKCNRSWSSLWVATFANGNIECKCGFKISEKRMSAIVADMVQQGLNAEHKNYEGFATDVN